MTITIEEQSVRLWGHVKGFAAVHLINTGVELGIFEALANQPSAPAALAAELRLHEPYVRTFCEVAFGLGLLEEDDGSFALSEHITELLASRSDPRYLGSFVALLASWASDGLREYPELFRSGEFTPFEEVGAEFTARVAQSTAGFHTVLTHAMLPKLPGLGERLGEGIDILDVGCGGGGLTTALARAYPQCRVVGVDTDPNGIALAEEALVEAELGDRARVELIDATALPFESEFDLAVMFEVLHEIHKEHRPAALTSIAQALRAGGTLVVVDETYPDETADLRRQENTLALLTAYLELGMGNVVPTRNEQEQLFRLCGLKLVHRDLIGGLFTLLVGVKPSS